MAIYYARANGNVNATNVWSTTAGGTTSDLFPSFTNADTLMANGFTVTLNVNTTVLEVRNDNANGATAGGSFSLSNGVILTSNIVTGSVTCLTLTGTASGTIVGNVTGGTGSAIGVLHTSAGTLTITGTVTAGSGANGYGASLNSGGTMNIIGNLIAGSSTAEAARNDSSSAGGTVVITGNITGGSAGYGYRINSTATVTIIGTVTGGSATGAAGLLHNQNGIVTISGTCIGGSVGAGAINSGNGTLICTRAKGGMLASSAVGVSASSTGSTTVEEIEYGDLGASPVSGRIILTDKKSNVAIMYRFGTTKKTLTDATATSGLIPSTSDVRRNVVYNGGNNVGTMDVPAAASVALGVSVDNTTGTAILTSGNIGDIWNYPVSGISVSNSIGERLKNCSTVASMGQQLAAALSNVQ